MHFAFDAPDPVYLFMGVGLDSENESDNTEAGRLNKPACTEWVGLADLWCYFHKDTLRWNLQLFWVAFSAPVGIHTDMHRRPWYILHYNNRSHTLS